MTPLQTPRTIPQYLDQLRAALAGADPALVQDALYDAEEYLRAELAENPGTDEATMLATVATSYGAPDEVADIYRVQETTVIKAMRAPPPAPRKSWFGRFFGVALDPHTYGSLLYMLLALPLGILYFFWAVAGVSLSAGLLVLIIGVPFIVLFIGTVYALSLVEVLRNGSRGLQRGHGAHPSSTESTKSRVVVQVPDQSASTSRPSGVMR